MVKEIECDFMQRLREHRLGGFVIFDTLLIIIVARILAYYRYNPNIHKNFNKYWLRWTAKLILGGIIIHKLAKVPTMLNYTLGLSEKPEIFKCLNNK